MSLDPNASALGRDHHSFTINKFGRNADTAVGDAIWVKSSPYPSVDEITPGVATIVSGDVADDGDPVGTGARTLGVWGLDGSKDLVYEEVILDGTTNVVGSQVFSRIYRMKVLTAGTGDENAGAITGIVDSLELSQIAIGRNQTEQAIYCVPNGYDGLLERVRVSFGNTSATRVVDIDILCTVSEDSNVLTILHSLTGVTVGSSVTVIEFTPPVKVPSKIDIILVCRAISAASEITAGFDLKCVKTSWRP